MHEKAQVTRPGQHCLTQQQNRPHAPVRVGDSARTNAARLRPRHAMRCMPSSLSYPSDGGSGGTRLRLVRPGPWEGRRRGCERFGGRLWTGVSATLDARVSVTVDRTGRRRTDSHSSLSASLRWEALHNLHKRNFQLALIFLNQRTRRATHA